VSSTVTLAPLPTAFFSKTYDEALALLIDARNYVAYEEAGDRAPLDSIRRLEMSRETTRLTARLTQVMAWLLFQKAILAGEIGRDPAARDRLDGQAVCLGDDGSAAALPGRLRDLLIRSHRLYVRVLRLDELLARDLRLPKIEDLWPGE
jgi:regulator of CtrA degradation